MRVVAALAAALALLLSPAYARADKFVLSVFHFNIQYVAGGLVGFSFLPDPALDLDNDVIEDLIVTQSFAPVLDLYEKHPTWGTDIELQGYFLDVLAARHPAVLEKLRKLAKSGQIEVVSFHYSDQLFIGYPEEDWQRSQALTAATFAKYDIPLSRTVFCQEGQSGEAMAQRFAEVGYRNMVWPKNLYSFQHGDFDAAPLYQFGDGYMIAGGKGVSTTDVEVQWSFMDDGELFATGDLNPYLADVFKTKPDVVKQKEDELLALEAQGYQITTVDKYVEAVKGQVTPVAPPPLLDGTWQPKSTTAVFKWLGAKGIWPGERDNHVRSLGALAHRELAAAETAAKVSGIDVRNRLDSAWRYLFLSEVTDASGINPYRGETEYGLSHATEALRIARSVINEAKAAMKATAVTIDPGAETMTSGASDDPLVGEPTSAPFELGVTAGDRSADVSWEQIAAGHHRVSVHFGEGLTNEVSVSFPGELTDEFVVTRALADTAPVSYKRSDFTFDAFYLALPIGLISLGPNLFLIKDMSRVHLAAKITRDSGDIAFADQTLADHDTPTWVFHVFEGSPQEAVDLARRINAVRKVTR
ncbi:MAG: hypothetical protein KC776_07460 [Myxococcales bacterium]|nr:hypothetical protein [Myxococcales bacterium]MCB9583093.1 hypothetical protein [Polyangiaceae bacterium]